MTRSALSLLIVSVLAAGCGGYAEPAPPSPEPAEPAAAEEAPAVPASPAELAAGVATIEIVPAIIEVQRGDSVTFRGILRDAEGNVVEGALWGVSTVGPFELRSIKDEIARHLRPARDVEYGEAVIGVFLGLPGPPGGQARTGRRPPRFR